MRNKYGTVLVIFVLLFCALNANGEQAAWDCPECGRTGNTGNYCGGCAHPAPWIEITNSSSPNTTPTSTPERVLNTLNSQTKVGDNVVFGNYEQDGNTNNGMEPIEWIVLAVEKKAALMISKYALDSIQYDQSKDGQTWEKCSLRKWLNNDFLNIAFNQSERKSILQKTVDNKKMTSGKNNYYMGLGDTKGGNNTKDYIYILSGDELANYFDSTESQQCKATQYAEKQGALLSTVNGNVWWWVRSPTDTFGDVYLVNSMGGFDRYEQNTTVGFTVRPVLWVKIQ